MKYHFLIYIYLFPLITLAQSSLQSAQNFYEYGELDSAINILNKVNVNKQNVNYVDALKAKIYGQKSYYTKALSLCDDSLLVSSKPSYLAIINAKGYLLEHQGFSYDAIQVILQGIRKFDEYKNNSEYTKLFIESYSLLGIAYWQTGAQKEANEYLKQALVLSKKLNDSILEANCNINLGLVNSSDEPFKAQVYYEKALKEYQKAFPNEDHPSVASIYINLGVIFQQNYFLPKAIEAFEKAASIWSKLYSNDHPNVAFAYTYIAEAYLKSNQVDLALEFYDLSLQLYQVTFGDKHPEIANIYIHLGDISYDQEEYKSALNYYQKAICSNSFQFKNEDPKANPEASDYLNPFINIVALQKKAEAFEKIHFTKTLKRNDLSSGIESLEAAHHVINKVRGTLRNEEDKIKLSEITNAVYSDGIRLSMELGIASVNANKWNEKAFQFMEWSKSATLLEAIQDTNAKTFAGIPKELIEKENSLHDEISAIEQGIIKSSSITERDSLENILFNTEQSLEELISDLEQDYPKYYNLKYNASVISLKDITNKISKNEALISYFISDVEELLYIFLVTDKGLNIYTEPFDDDFKDEIISLESGLKFNFDEIILMSSKYLSSRLLPFYLNDAIEKVTFLLDGKINSIPMEVLFYESLGEIDQMNAHQLPFMVTKYSIAYNFSATLAYSEDSGNEQSESGNNIAFFAPVNFTDSTGSEIYSSLPGTLSEVREIESIANTQGWSTSTYMYKKATKSNLLSASKQGYKYLHFATHGFVDEESPNQSFIFLNGEEEEPNLLHASEIYNLELNSKLVTLSACETGLGKISKGEGLIGLSRSLKYAGVENSIVSLWTVDDISTALLMQYFYEEIVKGENISKALKKAKIKLIKGSLYSSPYYWAAFSHIGH
ncbi:CHAT domain-containing tetratricopeptide repeat protein [Flammeovirga sp. SubArs3]|uniref:CHAT domain-containing protein n=1 Tax=Flammeovirga sp. SubArs3 TaxID=2995316 RepID=UPI00248D05EC|nr:CHAT domain-containing tetratricopeptide repeat protein [Flammeovirga sp. SubArs3]